MSAHAFRIHAVVCSNALPYFQYLVRNARELVSRDDGRGAARLAHAVLDLVRQRR